MSEQNIVGARAVTDKVSWFSCVEPAQHLWENKYIIFFPLFNFSKIDLWSDPSLYVKIGFMILFLGSFGIIS